LVPPCRLQSIGDDILSLIKVMVDWAMATTSGAPWRRKPA